MTGKTTFKTLVNEWLKDKEDMIKPSTHAGFALIAENHLIPYWGKRHIESITEADIQEYVLILYRQGRLDGAGVPAVKTIRDVILVLRLSLTYAYKKKIIQALNRDMIEYPKEAGSSAVTALSKEQEQELIRSIYMHLNRKTAGILITLFTGLRIGELCGLRMCDISLPDGTIAVRQTVQRIYDKKKGTSPKPPENKDLSFKGKSPIAAGIGKVLDNKSVRKLLKKYENQDKDIAKHLSAGTDILLTSSFAWQTSKSDKIKENRKKALIYNNVIATGITLAGGYGVDSLVKEKSAKFVERFAKANKGDPKLHKYIEGINIVRPALIFAAIYYGILPIFSTYMAEKIDNFIENKES